MIAVLFASALCSVAQDRPQFQVTGSLESSNIYYIEDAQLHDELIETNRFGTHTYPKVDLSYGRLTAGVQAEVFYPNGLQGFDIYNYGNDRPLILGSKHIAWDDKSYSVRLGNIYEQFGSGLVFRSYEDRALAFNNSIEGAFASVRLGDYAVIKGLYGRPRLYKEYAKSQIAGGDLSISLANLFEAPFLLNMEGSFVNRHQDLSEDQLLAEINKENMQMYSGRLNFNWDSWDIKAEYVRKENAFNMPTDGMGNVGQAYLIDASYTLNRFSTLATFRRLSHMNAILDIHGAGTGNVLNYLPSLTRQHTYMLANLNPYQVQADGEIGGQWDVYYSVRSQSDRYVYWNFHANFSTYYSDPSITMNESRLLWRDINADVEHQWNKLMKTTVLFTYQQWNPHHGWLDETYSSAIAVIDHTQKFNRKLSLRGELQYLYSKDYEKDWIALLIECSLAPNWSIAVSDMWNHGSSNLHYYNVTASYSKGRTRVQAGYGRNRAGYVCSGGVCRYQPAFTGASLTLTTSF